MRRLVLIALIIAAALTVVSPVSGMEVEGNGETMPDAVTKLMSESTVKPKVRLFHKGTLVRELIGRFPLAGDGRLDGRLMEFIVRHKDAFGIADPRTELITVRTGNVGGTDHLEFQQTSEGYPVWGATMEMEVEGGDLVLVVNKTLSSVPAVGKPSIKRRDALDVAGAEWTRQRGTELPPCASELIIYDGALAYDVKVPDGVKVYHMLVDATDAKIVHIEKIDRTKSKNCH